MVFLLFGWLKRKENKGSHILLGPPFPIRPNWVEMERKVEWRNATVFFDFLFLSKLQFCLFGLLLTSPINEGIKVNNTFSSFHFSAFANQTNISFLYFYFFFSLPLPASKHIPRKHFLYHFFSSSSFFFLFSSSICNQTQCQYLTQTMMTQKK